MRPDCIENPYIVTLSDPDSPIAEAYRNIKSMIVRVTKQNGFNNTLLVTSSLSGEGKSLSSLNLAVTLSHEYDHTVLLIDADLRNPSLHKYFNMEPKLGLSDCLTNGIDMGEALIRTQIEKLNFLPAGNNVPNPAELLSSSRMKDLVAEMKSRYSDRYIIIDTPPVLPFAESRSLSMIADGIIFVVREGMVPFHGIQEAIEFLKKGNIIGVLFNDVSAENLNGYHKYYYREYEKYKKNTITQNTKHTVRQDKEESKNNNR